MFGPKAKIERIEIYYGKIRVFLTWRKKILPFFARLRSFNNYVKMCLQSSKSSQSVQSKQLRQEPKRQQLKWCRPSPTESTKSIQFSVSSFRNYYRFRNNRLTPKSIMMAMWRLMENKIFSTIIYQFPTTASAYECKREEIINVYDLWWKGRDKMSKKLVIK